MTGHDKHQPEDSKDEHGHKDEHGDIKDKHEDSKQKSHLQSFDEETENIIKKVKQAMANGEGCRVFVTFSNCIYILKKIFNCDEVTNESMTSFLLQIYGVLDVQRVAGNFHISVHGLNIFVAQMVRSHCELHN